jgi:hypothetical protein
MVFGRRRAATVFAVVGVLVPLSDVAFDFVMGRDPVMLSAWFGIGVGALLVLALAAFHSDAPPVQHRPWLVAFGVGLLVGAVSEFAFLTQDVPLPSPLDWPAMACVVMVVAASVHLCRPASGPWFGALSWSLALVFLGLIVLGQRIVSLVDLRTAGPYPGRSTMIILAGAEAAVVLAVLVPLVVVAVRSLRHLPSESANLDSSLRASRQSPHPGGGSAT